MPRIDRSGLYLVGYRDGVLAAVRDTKTTNAVRIPMGCSIKFFCQACGQYRQRISRNDNFCRGCGRLIDWSEIKKDWKEAGSG